MLAIIMIAITLITFLRYFVGPPNNNTPAGA